MVATLGSDVIGLLTVARLRCCSSPTTRRRFQMHVDKTPSLPRLLMRSVARSGLPVLLPVFVLASCASGMPMTATEVSSTARLTEEAATSPPHEPDAITAALEQIGRAHV